MSENEEKFSATSMDRVQFDYKMEGYERVLKKAVYEVNKTRKDIMSGGYHVFHTTRLINDLKRLIADLEHDVPEGYIETAPLTADDVEPDTKE